jgi:lipoprotein-releasing system permease protein
MTFAWFVALRYLREGKTQTLLILGAVGIGVGVLVFLTALMAGLQANLLQKTLGSQAHVIVSPPEAAARVLQDAERTRFTRSEKPVQRNAAIDQYQQLLVGLRRQRGVRAVAAVVSGSAFAVRGAIQKSVSVRGVDARDFDAVIPIARHVRAGHYRLWGTEVLIGVELAADLGVRTGDKLRLITADQREQTFTIAGLFDLGSREVNERWALISLRSGQSLFDLAGQVRSFELKLDDVFDADAVAAEIAGRTGLQADSWMRNNPQLLVALQSQARSSNIMQFFVTLTVALGIASVLSVSVVQKSREIGILRAVGTQRARVQRVFLLQGAIVGFAGSLCGSLLGVGLARLFVLTQKNPDGSPIFPIEVGAAILIVPVILSTLVGLCAAVVPARRAARLDPAQVIRHG